MSTYQDFWSETTSTMNSFSLFLEMFWDNTWAVIRTRLCQAREGSEVSKTQPQPQRANACISCCCCSVAQSCPTLCDPMACSTPGFPVLCHLPELLRLMSTELMMPSNHLILCCPFSSCPQSFPASGSFPMSRLFASGGQSTGASVLASVLPVDIQDWFPLSWTGLISLQSKGLSRRDFLAYVWIMPLTGSLLLFKGSSLPLYS